jgi:hypothetical protein
MNYLDIVPQLRGRDVMLALTGDSSLLVHLLSPPFYRCNMAFSSTSIAQCRWQVCIWSEARNDGVTAPRIVYLELHAVATLLIT